MTWTQTLTPWYRWELSNIPKIQENSWLCQKFCNIFVDASLQCIYQITKAVQAVVGSVKAVGALTHCLNASLHMWFKSHTDEHAKLPKLETLASSKLGHNATKATKNICWAKSEGAVDYNCNITVQVYDMAKIWIHEMYIFIECS